MTTTPTTEPPPPEIDSDSPYHLGPYDDADTILTHIKLTNDNYQLWSRSVRKSLERRRKFGFCDGTIKKPTDSFFLEQWEVVNARIIIWILNTIDPSLINTLSFKDEAQELWTYLKDWFGFVNWAKIHVLKRDMYNCRQTKGMSVNTYFGNLNRIWNALAGCEPWIGCECGGGCVCGIEAELVKRREIERLYQFLMGLDNELYANVRTQLFLLDPLPCVNKAFNWVFHEEQRQEQKASHGGGGRGRGHGRGRGRGRGGRGNRRR